MPTGNPWRFPQRISDRSLRPAALAAILLAVTLLGYAAGSFLDQHAVPDTSAARLQVAMRALAGGYDRAAFLLLQPLAGKGDAQAQYHLATLYEHGWGTPVDVKKAVDLYRKAAQKSVVPAETRLAQIY